MKRILIVEDDLDIQELLDAYLRDAGYDTVLASDGVEALDRFHEAPFDLALLDVMLPKIDGFGVCELIRQESQVPILMLTARVEDMDKITGLTLGADDYITKPYNPTILLLRISAVLKRSAKVGAVQKYHDVEVSTVKGSLIRNGSEQILTKNEMIIFQLLLDRQGEIVTRDALMTALWDNDEFVNDNALSVNISRLRGKLAELGLLDAIETRKKQGYVLK